MKNNFSLIEQLLESNNNDSLLEARKLTREELSRITTDMSSLFLERQKLMWLIASSKRNSEAILQLDREYELILKFWEIANSIWEDERMIEMLIWLITAAWKEKQKKILERSSVFVKENIPIEILKKNLLELTDLVAEKYDDYWEWFDATKMAREFEMWLLENSISEMNNKWLAIDLWCANWKNTKTISDLWFEKVIWYDISPKMIEVAMSNNKLENLEYIEYDLFLWIPLENDSVDLVISNFWSASEISENIIPEIDRVLKKWWKAFFSFYNKNALMNDWWQPWQWSIEAVINTEDDIIEVPVVDWFKHKVFKVYAKSTNDKNLTKKIESTDLKIEKFYSHSLISAMMPPMFFDKSKRESQLWDYEKYHCEVKSYLWFYLVVIIENQ